MQRFFWLWIGCFLWVWGNENKVIHSFEDTAFKAEVKLSGIIMSQDQTQFKEGKASLSLQVVEPSSSITFSLQEKNWSHYHALSFWLSWEEGQPPPQISLELMGAQKKGGFRTKIPLQKSGWQHYELPLAFWSWKTWGTFHHIQSLKFSFQDPCKVWIDQLELVAGDRGSQSWTLTFEEYVRLAFPQSVLGVKAFYSENFCILTQMDVDGSYFIEECQSAYLDFAQNIPLGLEGFPRIYLVVYATPEEQQAFWDRVSEKLGKISQPVSSPSFTFQTFLSTTHKTNNAFMNPILYQNIQQFLMANVLGVFPRTDWKTMGLFYYLQYLRYPPDHLSSDMIQFLGHPANMLRLAKLVDSPGFEPESRLQAFSFIHFLAIGPYKDHFPAFLVSLRNRQDIKKFFNRIVKKTVEEVEREYLAFLLIHWPKEYTYR